MKRPVVGFAGMTHLGIVSATGVASGGFETVCFDPDETLVARLQAGDLPVLEPGLDELLASNSGRQHFTSAAKDLSRCDVVYLSQDVDTDDTGRSNTSALNALIDLVVPNLKPDACLVVLSQVEPGFTRAIAAPPEDRRYYQVETLVFGRAVERVLKPERYIVGCSDPAKPLNPNFRAVLKAFGCPILPMRYESAELAKISINMCLVASISVANTMSELCEQVGAVWHEIVPALKLDQRIGPYSYLAPGLGIAGGNLERDLATVIALAGQHGTDSRVVEAWLANSRHRRDWAVRTLRQHVLAHGDDPLVAVWGLAYKENTRSVKNSPSLATLAQLPEVRVRLHDPVVPASKAGHPRAQEAASALAAAQDADALMILTPWAEYREIPPGDIAAAMAGRTVLDPYRVLDSTAARSAGLCYHTLGMPALDDTRQEGR
jgi:UDPglucose 6-dehydrogenase